MKPIDNLDLLNSFFTLIPLKNPMNSAWYIYPVPKDQNFSIYISNSDPSLNLFDTLRFFASLSNDYIRGSFTSHGAQYKH